MTSTRHFVLNTELEWTMARIVCLLVHELEELGRPAPTRKTVAKYLSGRAWNTEGLTTAGALRFLPANRIFQLCEHLIEHDVLTRGPRHRLSLTSQGQALLDGRYLGAVGFLEKLYPPSAKGRFHV